MKGAALVAGMMLMVGGAVRAQERVTDPLELMERKRPALVEQTGPLSLGLDKPIDKGLMFLELWQSPDGSWDRLENSDPALHSRYVPKNLWDMVGQELPYDGPVKDIADTQTEQLADTCLSAQALLRGVVSGRKPEGSKNVLKAIEYVCGKAKFWNANTIMMQTRWLDPLHDPFPHPGSGDNPGEPAFYTPVVDTFFALSFLVEARSRIEKAEHRKMMDGAIPILLRKVEFSQDRSGYWPDPTDPAPALREGVFNAQCVAVNALNKAVRLGFPVNPVTVRQAEAFFLKNRRSVKPSLRVSTLYNMYGRRSDMLRGALVRMSAGASVRPDELVSLQKDWLGCREVLRTDIEEMLALKKPFTSGALLADLDDTVAAVEEIAPAKFHEFAMKVRNALIVRQRWDGRFISGISNDDSKENRGDNTFGTATTVMTLMYLDAKESKIMGTAAGAK